jgi:diketogulonate reductase-like aldo/keto reductase/DNA-binding XRE family transcriptional regulator
LKSLRSPAHLKLMALLSTARDRAGLTQQQLADRLGKPQSFVSKYEGGERRVDLLEFMTIARALQFDWTVAVQELESEYGSLTAPGLSDPLPAILYGTAWKKEQTAPLVQLAIEHGFRGIDTACQPKHYDEAGVGAGIAASLSSGLTRGDLYLQTKFTPPGGQDPDRIPYDPAAPLAQQVAQSFRASLRNLQTDYLDCLVLHSPLAAPGQTETVWRAMEEIVAAGGARRIGISNCYALHELRALHASARVKPAIVQNRFHAQTGYDRDIRAFCKQSGIIYQSFWTLTANAHVLRSAPLESLARKYRRTPAQILFRHLTQEGIVPLTGTRSPQHMRDDLAIFEFELAAEERALLEQSLSS